MRQAKALALFLDGKPLTEIADVIGVDYSTAWRYVRRELDASRIANAERAEAIRQQQYQTLNRIVRESLRAYQASCQLRLLKVRVTDRQGRHGREHETVRQEEMGPGDVRFLEIAMQALAEIRTLFGMGLSGSETAVTNSGPIEIVTRWGGELSPPVQPLSNAAATCNGDGIAAIENTAHSGNAATADAEENVPAE